MAQSTTVPLPEPGKPKLLDQVRQRCRVRHLALKTEHAFVGWIRRYILFHQKRHPLEMGAPQVSTFLTHREVNGYSQEKDRHHLLIGGVGRGTLIAPIETVPGSLRDDGGEESIGSRDRCLAKGQAHREQLQYARTQSSTN